MWDHCSSGAASKTQQLGDAVTALRRRPVPDENGCYPRRHDVTVRMRSFLLCLLAVVVWAPATGWAEQPFRFDSSPGKLPKNVVPTLYDLAVTPDIEKRAFVGHEAIDVDVKTSTDRFVLNAKDLVIDSVELAWKEADERATFHPAVTMDAARETCTLVYPSEIPTGTYRLSLHFTGKINQDGAGLFASTYTGADGKPETVLCTQMEPADARRLFPCWDEPAFRAKFRVSVELTGSQKDLVAISNMPLETSAPVGDGQRRTFQTTPPMASYLVMLAAGNFEVLSGEADGTAIHVIAAKGRGKYGQYALETAQKLLHFYNDYFGVKFPLPKLDLLAVSGGSSFGGAMENWGAITFAEPALLYDPAASSQSHQERVFEVIAHEMAHQWFGDLVTMGWWDNLWLNEGFAEWMGESAADHFNPSWQYWENIAGNKDYAMTSDARATTHPIQQPVVDEMDAVRAFDEITYNKGQGFIRMLENYLGPEKFRAGLRHYMKAHAYGNTTTADLWAALEEASGQPVSAIAAGWTEQPGFPLISVHRDRSQPDEIKLGQQRFTVHDPHAAPLHWKVPVTYVDVSTSKENSLLLDADTTVATSGSAGPFKFNVGGTGYYRTSYDEASLRPLLARFNDLEAPDQSNLLRDAWAAAHANLGPITAYLAMVKTLRPEETNPLVWAQVCAAARSIDDLYVGGDPVARQAWRTAMVAILRPVFVHYGWQPLPNEGAPAKELRAILIERLGFFGDPLVVGACKERFAAFLSDPSALPPDIRRAVCDVVGHTADAAVYDELTALVGKASSDEQKGLLYGALAGATDPALAQKTLALAAHEATPSNFMSALLRGVATAGEQPDMVVQFIRANLGKLVVKVSPMAKNMIVPGAYATFHDAARADELERYAKESGAAADATQVKKSAETIRAESDFKARVLPEISRWTREN